MLRRAEQVFVRANQAFIGAMMVTMFALVFTNVVTRYGFGFSIAWAEEVSGFLMIWITYIGAGLALRQGRHVAIELFQDMLPPRMCRAVRSWPGWCRRHRIAPSGRNVFPPSSYRHGRCFGPPQ